MSQESQDQFEIYNENLLSYAYVVRSNRSRSCLNENSELCKAAIHFRYY